MFGSVNACLKENKNINTIYNLQMDNFNRALKGEIQPLINSREWDQGFFRCPKNTDASTQLSPAEQQELHINQMLDYLNDDKKQRTWELYKRCNCGNDHFGRKMQEVMLYIDKRNRRAAMSQGGRRRRKSRRNPKNKNKTSKRK